MIRTLILKKIGLFKNTQIPLDQINCIYGPNESGKTTIFEALCFVLCQQNGATSFGRDIKRRYGNDIEVETEGSLELCLSDSNDIFASFAFDSRRINEQNAEGFLNLLLPESAVLDKAVSILDKQSSDHKSAVQNKDLDRLRTDLQAIEQSLQKADIVNAHNDDIRDQIHSLKKQKRAGLFSIIGGITLLISGSLSAASLFSAAVEAFFFPLLMGSVLAMVSGAAFLFKSFFSSASSKSLDVLYSQLRPGEENRDAIKVDQATIEAKIQKIIQTKRASHDALSIFKKMQAEYSSEALGERINFWYSQMSGEKTEANIHGFNSALKKCTALDAQNVKREFNDLSAATQSSFLLALRLAICESIQPRNGIFILDDPCIHMDEQRTQKTMDAIIAFALEHDYQLLLFTKDTFLKDYFRKSSSIKERSKVLELKRS